MLPYIATVTNPAVIATMRQRATTPGVWNNADTTKWPGTVGATTGAASCPGGSGAGGNCAVAKDLGRDPTEGYRGTAWPSTMFPLGDGRPAPTDLATRFVGGLVATPLIQYYEYSRDVQMLKDHVYPFVKDNAEFYASWALNANGSGPLMFPYTCAQEACACRNGLSWYWKWGEVVAIPLPNMTEETIAAKGVWDTSRGEHNAHADIAFASASFRKAAEYAKLLGVDAGMQTSWLALLARMPVRSFC
jgi:hypothetical protein